MSPSLLMYSRYPRRTETECQGKCIECQLSVRRVQSCKWSFSFIEMETLDKLQLTHR